MIRRIIAETVLALVFLMTTTLPARAGVPTATYIDLGVAEEFAFRDLIDFTDRLFILNAEYAETNTVEVYFDFGLELDAPEYFDLQWCSLNTLSGDYLFDYSDLPPSERYVYQGTVQFLELTHVAVVEQVLCAGNLGFDVPSQSYFEPPALVMAYLEYSSSDLDGDDVLNPDDNCVSTYNASQSDADGDFLGDACDLRIDEVDFLGAELGYFDDDYDGIADHDADFNLLPFNEIVGTDDFGNSYYADNCPDTYNPQQWDTDFDGTGDDCDFDYVYLDSLTGDVLSDERNIGARTVGISDYTHSIRIRASEEFVLDSCEVAYFDESIDDYSFLFYDFAALASDGTYELPAFTSEYLAVDGDPFVADVSCLAFGENNEVLDVYYEPGALPFCTGDCNADGEVTIDELIKGVNVALGNQTIDTCFSFDENGDNQISINELVQGVLASLEGCPSALATIRSSAVR